jgi:oligopeptide transport system ATP-binding protein
MDQESNGALLQTRNLKVYFPVKAGIIRDRVIGWVRALDGVDLTLNRGQVIGLVGESGSGKTTLGKTILVLERATEGEILFEGRNVYTFNKEEMKTYRRSVKTVFQDPFASLSPRMRVREIIGEPLQVGMGMKKDAAGARVAEVLTLVGLDAGLMNVFPHELSGGQRQRVAIARSISTRSKIIILDEPTSALDVSVRLQIVHLLMELQKQLELSYLLIGHDLAMVAYMSTNIAVMYLGKIVEMAETKELLSNIQHPYTQALISAALPDHPKEKKERIILPGEIPSPMNVPHGCRFHPRCLGKKRICSEEEPRLVLVAKDHYVACHLGS